MTYQREFVTSNLLLLDLCSGKPLRSFTMVDMEPRRWRLLTAKHKS